MVVLEFIQKSSAGEESLWQRITLTNAAITEVNRTADFAALDQLRDLEEITLVWQKITVADVIGTTSFTDNWI